MTNDDAIRLYATGKRAQGAWSGSNISFEDGDLYSYNLRVARKLPWRVRDLPWAWVHPATSTVTTNAHIRETAAQLRHHYSLIRTDAPPTGPEQIEDLIKANERRDLLIGHIPPDSDMYTIDHEISPPETSLMSLLESQLSQLPETWDPWRAQALVDRIFDREKLPVRPVCVEADIGGCGNSSCAHTLLVRDAPEIRLRWLHFAHSISHAIRPDEFWRHDSKRWRARLAKIGNWISKQYPKIKEPSKASRN